MSAKFLHRMESCLEGSMPFAWYRRSTALLASTSHTSAGYVSVGITPICADMPVTGQAPLFREKVTTHQGGEQPLHTIYAPLHVRLLRKCAEKAEQLPTGMRDDSLRPLAAV